MAAKPKARKAPRKTGKAEKQEEQSARFIKAARELGVDEAGREFDRAMSKIIGKRPVKPST
jgi:hypothetical protein